MNNAIEIENLTVIFKTGRREIRALDRLNLTVESGHIFGFLGPNGAGKTTAMHVLMGFISDYQGTARIFGCDVRKSIARSRLGYLTEHPDTYRFLTGVELLKATGLLFGLRGETLRKRIDEILNTVGLTESANRRIGTYSRGMIQRICLAQALLNNPDLLILDEPTSGLDPIGRMEVRSLILSLKQQGKTVFFSSHELSEVDLVCDRLAIISRGRIVAEGKTDELIKPGENLETYFLRMVGWKKNRSGE